MRREPQALEKHVLQEWLPFLTLKPCALPGAQAAEAPGVHAAYDLVAAEGELTSGVADDPEADVLARDGRRVTLPCRGAAVRP